MNHKFRTTGTAVLAFLGLTILATMSFVGCGGDDDDEVAPTTAAAQPTAVTEPTKAATVAATVATAATRPPTTAPAPGRVQIGDNFFQPGTVTVKAGEKVTWSWSGGAPHSVLGTFDGKEVKSETKTGSGSFEFTFTKAGTFDYACGIHGPSMPGKIVIQ